MPVTVPYREARVPRLGSGYVMTLLRRPLPARAEALDMLPPHMLRAWRIFALGWTFMLGPTLYVALRMEHRPLRLVPGIAAIVILAALYLRVTMGGPVDEPDRNGTATVPATGDGRLLTLGVMAVLVVTASMALPRLGAWWLMMFPIIAAGLILPARRAAVVMAVLLAIALLSSQLIAGRLEVMLLAQAAIAGGAIAIRQLTVTLTQLELARAELAHRAVDQERLRIARDLHDLLGRTLSVIVLKSELAIRRLPDSPALAAAEVRDIERAGREALQHIRGAVSGYRKLTVPGELAIASELLAAQGIAADITDTATPLPPAVDALLAWAVREGVTNVMRHSRATACTIEVRLVDDVARVSVVDDGRGEAAHADAAGHGLAGLRERAEAQGGRLRTGTLPTGGYHLTMEVPLDAFDTEEP